jgi:hypothetical protein
MVDGTVERGVRNNLGILDLWFKRRGRREFSSALKKTFDQFEHIDHT